MWIDLRLGIATLGNMVVPQKRRQMQKVEICIQTGFEHIIEALHTLEGLRGLLNWGLEDGQPPQHFDRVQVLTRALNEKRHMPTMKNLCNMSHASSGGYSREGGIQSSRRIAYRAKQSIVNGLTCLLTVITKHISTKIKNRFQTQISKHAFQTANVKLTASKLKQTNVILIDANRFYVETISCFV